jgi:hypothetical protein
MPILFLSILALTWLKQNKNPRFYGDFMENIALNSTNPALTRLP